MLGLYNAADSLGILLPEHGKKILILGVNRGKCTNLSSKQKCNSHRLYIAEDKSHTNRYKSLSSLSELWISEMKR